MKHLTRSLKAKVIISLLALIFVMGMAMPIEVAARPFDGISRRVENNTIFVPLRSVADAHGATVEWNSINRTAHVTGINGNTWVVRIDEIGGFIDQDRTWIPYDYAARMFESLGDAEEAINSTDAGTIFTNIGNMLLSIGSAIFSIIRTLGIILLAIGGILLIIGTVISSIS
ncbi:MAG: copper amine oxidase N-terminal domain-containing protein [Defluviitaleaceae bacterium]|nr:copper amine oxidase N-terminal domain-containing protein [Defluviitaleaceae bacterium]